MKVIVIVGEVHFHAGIQISIVGSIFFHLICDKFESFPHAVFGHLLFGLS